MKRVLLNTALLVSSTVYCVSDARALPWDEDLFRQQSYQPGEIARTPLPGTVPVGHRPFSMSLDDGEKLLRNPVPFTRESVIRGRRMYTSNCLTCHGALGDGKGPVGPKMAVPNLLDNLYKSRGDGRIYTIMMTGGSNMPRYGYKFSENERWDLVNYVRFLQGRDAAGVQRSQ